MKTLNLSNLNMKFIEAFSIWHLSKRLFFGSPKSSNLTREFSESLSIFSSIFFKPFMRSAHNIVYWWQQRKKWESVSGSRLQLHRGFIQSLKLCLNLCSLRYLNLIHKQVRYLRPTGLNIL